MLGRLHSFGAALVCCGMLAVAGCSGPDVLAPDASADALQPSFQRGPSAQSCWGQASAVFAQMGEMGEHSSSFDTPRLGLRNLARQLYEADIIAEDTMQALGSFVADELGLTIEACR
jgi:hypothetical protein